MVDDEYRYGPEVWISIKASDEALDQEERDRLIEREMAGILPYSITIMHSGHDGPGYASYQDVRKMENIIVDEFLGYVIYEEEYNRDDSEEDIWFDAVLKPLTKNQEEYDALKQAGVDHGEKMALFEAEEAVEEND